MLLRGSEIVGDAFNDGSITGISIMVGKRLGGVL